MNDETNDRNRQLHELLGRCWHGDTAFEFSDKAPPDGWFQCECGEKSFSLPFDNPDYCSPNSSRKLLDEVEAEVIQKVGLERYGRVLYKIACDFNEGVPMWEERSSRESWVAGFATMTTEQRVDACIEVLTEK